MTPFDYGVSIKVETDGHYSNPVARVQSFAHPFSLFSCKPLGGKHNVSLMVGGEAVMESVITHSGLTFKYGDIETNSNYKDLETSFDEVGTLIWGLYDHNWSYQEYQTDQGPNIFWRYVGTTIISKIMSVIMKTILLFENWSKHVKKRGNGSP